MNEFAHSEGIHQDMATALGNRHDKAVEHRRLPVGAEVLTGGGVHFRVWAPAHDRVDVVLEGISSHHDGGSARELTLTPEGNGYHSGTDPAGAPGILYRYRLVSELLADPASRFQPDGPHGPSQVIDPGTFAWTDHEWRGPELKGMVVYEIHVGTFTPEGTWAAAAAQLPALVDLGINAVETLPVADFPGRFGWGYDGVNLYAPTRLYGVPDDFRGFVDRAHRLGIAVLLDVVYNHLGPDGNSLPQFAEAYFTDRYKGEWGTPLNLDGDNCGPVREFVAANAGYWIDEFHLDGLRIDATQSIFDASREHILSVIARTARSAAGGRRTVLIGENEEQKVTLIRPRDQGGYGLDALWNEDFHHTARVAATGRSEAYFSDYHGSPQEFISTVKRGFLYQGQRNTRQGKHRGSPTFGIAPASFVNYLQNHDQVANTADGRRVHALTSPGRYRALTALLLLAPATPLLFQGQDYGASNPFHYFSDLKPEIAKELLRGRRGFLVQFRSQATASMQERVPRPDDPQTFERSRLAPSERERHPEIYSLHRDLLKLRREDPAFHAQRIGGIDGAVLGPEVFVLRYFVDEAHGDRLLIVNLGQDLHFNPAAEPLMAPVPGSRWGVLWSSEDPSYGGGGTAELDTAEGWRIPGHAAVALFPDPEGPRLDG